MELSLTKEKTKMETYEVTVENDGSILWYQNGQLHRLDGPAFEYVSGSKFWYQNGVYHRVDGPAVEWANGFKAWYQNGKPHRLDGPAIEYPDGAKFWYIEGKKYTEEEFNKKINPVKELSVKQISELLGYEIKIIK
jgi:hypothetical protein